MPQTMTNNATVAERSKALYAASIRAKVETDATIGKLVYIDADSGDYEIGDDIGVDAPRRLQARHTNAPLYAIRIGYNVVDSFGGVVERIT